MSRFVYLLSEGVHDVAFLSRVLTQLRGASKVNARSRLDEPRQRWVDGFKWPVREDIGRLAVPAPTFLLLPTGDTLIGLRNSQGIDQLAATLEDDLEVLYKLDALPDAIGVFLDSDQESQAARFAGLRAKLLKIAVGHHLLEVADELACLATGEPRVGVFAFPRPGAEGTLEDLLLDLGRIPYQDLCAAASTYVAARCEGVLDDPHRDWRGLRAQSGVTKATFAAATAILKPGRGSVATIEDNRWVGDETHQHPSLSPCLEFLDRVLAPPGPEGGAHS